MFFVSKLGDIFKAPSVIIIGLRESFGKVINQMWLKRFPLFLNYILFLYTHPSKHLYEDDLL